MCKTGRLLIAHEAPLTGGFAGEVASTIQVRVDTMYMYMASVCDDRYHACTFAWDKLGALFTPH